MTKQNVRHDAIEAVSMETAPMTNVMMRHDDTLQFIVKTKSVTDAIMVRDHRTSVSMILDPIT